MTTVLELSHVTVRRGMATILDDVNWQVSDTDRWIILGANGAGKTTLLQILAANMFPAAGTVHILGERLGGVDVFELRQRVGLCSTALAERLPKGERVLDVVRTAAYGMTGHWREHYEDADTDRALALLQVFGVGDLQDRSFGSLSEGERKRVQIARSLMSDPEILLLDEPGAGLDLGGREELIGALAELAADPRSPVLALVTHHVEEIPPGFTHAMVLRNGRVQAAGSLESVINSEQLSACFGLDLTVTGSGGRWTAQAARKRHGRYS